MKKTLEFVRRPLNFLVLNLFFNSPRPRFQVQIAREIEATTIHVTKIIRDLEELGLLIWIKIGIQKKRKYYTLTQKGREVAVLLNELSTILK